MAAVNALPGKLLILRQLSSITLVALAACKPAASDDYLQRVNLAEAKGTASAPLLSPDVTNAVWAESASAQRFLYGIPGQAPFLALACEQSSSGEPQISFTRFARADPGAKALFALIGNGHIARLPVEAKWNGRAWLWEGTAAADEPGLEVLTGRRDVAATLPGAGRLELNASPLPARLIDECRSPAVPS